MIEIINQILTTIMLLAATILIITVTIILIKHHGRRPGGEELRPPQIRPVQSQVESALPTPPPTKPQEAQTTEEDKPKPEEYSWILNLGKRRRKETTQT